MSIVLKRICQPLHQYTFKAPQVKQWVEDNCVGKTLNLFAGTTKLLVDELRVDLDKETNPDFCMDALEFVQTTQSIFNTIILDPPYAYRKSTEKYKGYMASPLTQLKDALIRILPIGGIVITFGSHGNSMGTNRGFELQRVFLMYRGGAQHDTIALVEKKIQDIEVAYIKEEDRIITEEEIELLKELEL